MKIIPICNDLYKRVTDRQTDGRTDGPSYIDMRARKNVFISTYRALMARKERKGRVVRDTRCPIK